MKISKGYIALFLLAFLELWTTSCVDAQTEGMVGVWVDERPVPWEMVAIVSVDNSYRMTLLPMNEYQQQKSFLLIKGDGYYYFENEKEAYFLYPHPEQNTLNVEHAESDLPDSFTVAYVPLKNRSLISKYLMLNDKGVRLRRDRSLLSEILRTTEEGEVVTVLGVDKEETTIQGKTSHWTKVSDLSGKVGWIFGAFLAALP